MKVTGEMAVRLGVRYGLPIHKEADATKATARRSRSKTRGEIVRHGNPQSIYTEAEPELVTQLPP